MKYTKIDHMDFMCSHCQTLTTVKIEPKYWGERFYRYVENYQPDHCPKCGFSAPPIYIDPDIAESIVILNQKNWLTKFCCSGHISMQRRVEFPYVMFENPLPPDVVVTLPETWYLDDDDFADSSSVGCVIRAHADDAIRSGSHILPANIARDYRDVVLPNAIKDFNEWALKLHKRKPLDEFESIENLGFYDDSCEILRIDGRLYILDCTRYDASFPIIPRIYSFGYDDIGRISGIDNCPNCIQDVVDRYIGYRRSEYYRRNNPTPKC